MRNPVGTILLLVPFLLVRGQGLGGSSLEAKVLALDKSFCEASQRGDGKVLDVLLDSSTVYTSENGLLKSKSQLIEDSKTLPHRNYSLEGPVTVNTYGAAAVVTGVYCVISGRNAGPHCVRFVHTWVSQGGAWVCVSGVDTPVLP
jgi:hypothetical protein